MKHLFLTGATGLVGRYLLRDLLHQQVPLAVLCRPNRMESAEQRVESLIERWERLGGRKLPRPVVLRGSLTEPGLGLDAAQLNWLTQNCDVVLHNAASMTFREDKHHEPFRTNVDGMKNLLAVCEQARLRQFHHVSTAYVCGLREGRVFESELDLGQQNGNVYEVSKLRAEKLVREAKFLDQLTIYRPASVVGDSETGYTASSHGFYLPLQMAYIMADKVPPELMGERFFRLLGLSGEEGKNLVPVDWLSAGIVRLLTRPEHHGQTYHMTNPRPVSVRLIQQVIREAIEIHSNKRFVGTPTEQELRGYEELFCQYMEIYRSHWRDDPTFDRTNTDRALADLPCTELNYERMLAIASYPVKQKFIFNDSHHSDDDGDDVAESTPKPANSNASSQPAPQLASETADISPVDVPIAIVGMACRLPGANNLDEYWQLIANGRSAIAEVPPERLDRSLYYDPRKGQRGKTYSTLGGMLESRQFDRQACPIPAELERSVDNAHLLMCEVAAAACQQAGLDPFNLPLRNTGVYIGHAQGSDLSGKMVVGTCIEEAAQFLREVPAFQALSADQQQAAIDGLVENMRSQASQRGPDSPDLAIHMVAGTISKAFGLTGPFMAINSACASSLHTIQLAARALQLGRIDMAIVGGASDLKDGSLVLFANAQSMTESGSRPFDESADGLVVAEGYVALVLKTLPRALADGDPIQGIVMGIGASSDGRGKSLWAPRKEGQVAAMERAYRNGLDMSTLQYVECHATSTSLGDATELNSLSEILATRFPNGKKIPVTSVKANIGHALEAAGIAGLIKTVLCMQHRTFAPAINIRSLNSKINWSAAPIYIPQQPTTWPEQADKSPRRAAVNAFGIGGLNVHLVVEEFTEARRDALRAKWCRPATKSSAADADDNAIAIIGMGCIFPGATGMDRYWELIHSGRDPKSTAPADRWRTDLFCESRGTKAYRASNSIGGFIKDFAYDWKRHKVPPKQVEQADPLQFMLLDAAEQALNDAGYDKKEFDRARTAVLVGTEFNGDFGAQLAVSLRLPELERLLKRLLAERNVSADQAAEVARSFGEILLKHWPSLIDESGSFSTSTLASRITKTMNLMGGAASIDAGDASAAAALATGIDLLLSGDCDLLLCAGGQRSMNLPQYEAMTQCGVLAKGEHPVAPFDAGATGIVPGEGVGMVLLKRLSDARRDGDRIRAIIRGVGAAHSESLETSLKSSIERAFAIAGIVPAEVAFVETDGTGLPQQDTQQLNAIADVYAVGPRNQPLAVSTVVGQIGHTGGASAMASLLKASVEMAHGEMPRTAGLATPLVVAAAGNAIRLATSPLPIHSLTDDGRRIAAVSSAGKGLSYHILLEHGERTLANPMTPSPTKTAAAPTAAVKAVAPMPSGAAKIYRFSGQTADELAQQVTRALAQLPAQSIAEGDRFDAASRVRLAIVANSPKVLAEKLQSFLMQQQNPAGLAALEQQGCFYRHVSEQTPRVAFVFPGQGSQYPGMLRELVQQSPAAARTMATLDALLVERGFPTFEDLAWQRPELLGSDIWSTQLSMLLANLIAHAAVIEAGIRPDLVTGHSYGEFAAITAAGAWSLASAISAARARVDGIEATAGARGAMLATSAPPQMVEPLATALPERAYLANYNSPDQTVVGGREESLRQLSKLLDVMGHKAQMIPVPCPFHTPLMEGTADLLRQILPTLSIDPPRVPLLSSVTNRYVAEPDEIRDNLAAQLTTPVRYLDLITRIASERDTVFIEIGPQQALTRLNRRILEGRNVPGIIAIDHPKRPGHEQMLHVRALLECVGAFSADGAATTNVATPFVSEPRTKFVTKPQKGSISHVDGTERRRSKMRAAASGPAPARAIGGADAPRAPMQPSTATMAQPAPHRNDNGAAAKPTVASRPAVEVKRAQPARDPKELQQFLINFVVEQTGYPPEVVELDADLEADLGIDSIKKAQLFGELAEYFDVQPDEDMTLDDFPTLRHVSEFLQGVEFKKELVSEAAQQSGVAAAIAPAAAAAPRLQEALPPTAAATVAATSSPSVAKSAATGQSIAELERFLVNFVVEQTGYPPEVVELDADLEADLGIDSIKKAQLFGELAEYFDVQPYEGMTLDDFPTLRHVTEFLQGAAFKQELASEVVSQSSATASPPTVSATAAAPVPRYQEAPRPTVAATIAAVSATAVAEPAPAGQSVAELEQFLVNFVVEQTGYPPEVVELDADLEADLGIDSIKKAQLFGELAEYFDVRPDENMTLDDFPTLRHVVNFLARDAVKKKGVTHPGDSTDFDAAAGVATEAMALASDRPSAPYDLEDASHDVSHRYALRTLPSALPENTPAMPRWFGAAMIVGEGPAAEALNKQLLSAGVTVVRLAVGVNLNQTLAQFQAIWNRQPIYHLFLMQGRDGSALDVADHESWRERRYRLATLPFYLCQRWTQLAAEAKVLNRCTLVAATSLGGDFGFSGGVKAPESGAITGLLKAIFIEYNILRKFDTFLVKAIDAPDDEAPELLAANICRELASREVDYEVAYAAGVRHVQNAYLRASQARQYAAIRPGGVWVLTGGARGITALCGLELGRRFGLQLHLLGSSPLPKVDPAWRALDEAGLKALQSAVMREARAKNQSMDEAWSRVRKDLEIDRTLARFQEAGIIVRYHQCDVADEAALARVLDEIRQTSGPIEGILHGAGIERSCNYERKKPEVVEATLASKVDGALNLMRLTRQDPIRHFVGFGSVSGRLGSNGQTDYCMASDLLCKLTGWYRTWRPEVRAVGIHWHPWAEVGMAATPETAKLLKLSGGPTSMDKVEGVRHLMRELYASDADTEVMITDDDYFGRYYLEAHPPRLLPDDPATDSPPEIAARHQLRLVEAPLPSSPHPTHLTGAACILGDNPAARALRDRLDELSVPVELLPVGDSAADVLAAVERRYAQSRFQHLFLMTGRDAVADPLQDWPSRRARGVTIPFLATQQWFRLRRKAKDSSPITISAATSLGGDFGIASNVAVPDGGALSGLLKSLHIEDSRKPQRELRAKVIDFPETESPAAIAGALIDELTHDDPNVEVAWSNGRRRIVRSFVEPVESLAVRSIEPGSVWVVTGGARGITAAAALEMGKRFRLKLHLIGRSAAPQPDAPWRNYSEQQLAELKTQVVRRAVAEGRSPESDWDRVKHDREIHENLSKFTAAGVTFTYHSCNVADREQLARVLDEIRTAEGRIDGIVHGAGWARSGRFDSRSADVLDKTIAAKLDGAINLITLTADDPIRHWVGFGSISGRYGGNGLSDYAAANEMLAKLLAWYRRARPDCAACCVHWQSWDEVGMAMLADSSTVGSKGVLKMEFISPREGSNHLCRELAAGLPSPETVITDGYFEQTFYPHIKAEQAADLPAGFAIVDSTTPIEGAPGILAHVQFQPDKDPFLYDHTLRGKPLLPAVVGLEAIAEAAALLEAKPVVALRQVEFREGLSFQPGQPIAARVQVERSKSGALMCQLLSEFKNRAGIVLQKNRVHFIGQVEVADAMPSLNATYSNPPTDWHPFEFRTDGPMVHGPTFQGVNRVTFAGDMGWGELTALSLGNLGGPHRKNNWLVPATLLDAAFYVCGIHLWLNVEPAPALPQSIEALRLGRLPRDGEPAWVQVRCRKVQGRQAIYDFAIFDEQRMPILQVEGYGCVMLKAKTEATVDA